jgi:hypothetical protein
MTGCYFQTKRKILKVDLKLETILEVELNQYLIMKEKMKEVEEEEAEDLKWAAMVDCLNLEVVVEEVN